MKWKCFGIFREKEVNQKIPLMHPALYVANLVDYGRILALIIAVLAEKACPAVAVALLCISDGLDGIDGYLARKLN